MSDSTDQHFAVLERQIGATSTQILSQLARIAHATEAIARKLDPDFKTEGEINREKRRSPIAGKSEA